MQAELEHRGPGNVRIATSKPNDDLSGLIVEVIPEWDGIVDALEQTAGVPVTIRRVDALPVPLADK